MSILPVSLKRKREEFEKDAIELLTCPICFEYLSVPTYECRKGHILCQECYKSLLRATKICPQCRCSLETGVLENDFINQMLSCFSSECSYKRNGCNLELNFANRRTHEESCIYKFANTRSEIEAIRCPFYEEVCSDKVCGRKLNKDNIISHFKESHSIGLETYRGNRFNINPLYHYITHDSVCWCSRDYFIKLDLGYFYIFVEYVEQCRIYLVPILISPKDVEGKVVSIRFEYRSGNGSKIFEFHNPIKSEDSGSNIRMFILDDVRIQELYNSGFEFLININ